MANETPPRQMSLIPYPYRNGEVVLRRGNAIVVYDTDSRQLSVHNDSDQALEVTDCPYCHRPMRDDFVHDGNDEHMPSASGLHAPAPYLDPDYFRKLAASRAASPTASEGPGTPTRHFIPPALPSLRSREVSGAQGPPSGAEFIGSEPSASARQGISKGAFSPGFFKQFFRELRILGKGGNGVVLLVEHVMDRVSLGQFACKRIPVGDDHDWLEKVLLEVKLLQKVPHANLVAYHWVWLEDYQTSQFAPKIPCLWILQEFCNGGDLHSYIRGPQDDETTIAERLKRRARRRSRAEVEPTPDFLMPTKLSFDEIFSFFRDITSGLHHLHSKGYIHRDLKPSNCLIHIDGNRSRVLISDFGEVQAAGAKRGSTGATGTISYCAPEVLRQDVADGAFGEFTTKSDIFSLGMIVYFMCFGRLPYNSVDDVNEENEDLDELRAEVTQWPGFDDQTRARPDLPERLYKYLKRLLSVDPNERPSTEEILSSIRGGSGFGEMSSPFAEENSTRVSSLDSPNHRPSPPRRKQSSAVGRPGLSSLRQVSIDTLRARSPTEHRSESSSHHRSPSRSHSRPTSPLDSSSIVMRPREYDHPPSGRTSPGPKSPRLMLPPPPPSSSSQDTSQKRVWNMPASPTTAITALRALLFVAKTLSLLLPCSPYVANAWILYPLLGLATLDVLIPTFAVRRMLFFLGIHVVVLILALQRSRLCQRMPVAWAEL